MKEFFVNDLISLRLEKDQTVIYINGEKFNQCKYILLNRKIDELEDLLSLETIDELADNLDHFMEGRSYIKNISLETEFWVHCSNLQIWAENNYDTRLLHSNLAFPLLKKLVDVGDKKAQIVFKEEIAKRLGSKYPSVVGYLVNEKYIDYLPFDYVIDIIADKDLSKDVISKGYEFDFTVYLEDIGEKYSHIIKNKIIDIIQDQRWDDLIHIKESGLLENLTKKDLLFLIENPEVDIISKIFSTIKDTEKYDYYYQDGFYFYKKVIGYASYQISKKLLEIIRRSNREEIFTFIRLDLLIYLNNDDLNSMVKDSEIDIIEMLLELNKKELFDWFHKFFKKIGEIASRPVRNYILKVIKENNLADLRYILEENLLDNLNKEDLIYLIEDPNLLFVETIAEISRDLDSKQSFFLYGSPFNDRLLDYGCKSLKNKVIKIVEENDEYDIRAIIRLGLIECLSDDELKSLLNRCDLDFFKYLLKVKKYDYEDVEKWIDGLFKKLEDSLSNFVKRIIMNSIKKGKLEELSYFFDLEMLNYLNDSDKLDLYKLREVSERQLQKNGNYLENKFFNKILKEISIHQSPNNEKFKK